MQWPAFGSEILYKLLLFAENWQGLAAVWILSDLV